MKYIKYAAKAVVAGTVTFCSSFGVAVSGGVSATEWCVIIPATVLAVAGVFGIENGDVPNLDEH